MTPYLICFYDGKNFYYFYLSDYNSVEEMMLNCLKSILIRKYKGYSVYAHNLAKFDIIFLLKYLVKIGNINPIIHNGKIISLIINYGENGQYKIEFKDSLLLLLTSLRSLCSCFKIDESKSIFPHLFVNENNLDYNGEVPNINNFIKISKDEYQYYKLNYFNGNILKIDSNAFGFFYCKIIAPDNIKHPILQTRVKVNGIYKTIAPIGS